jgi:hypothetical protein
VTFTLIGKVKCIWKNYKIYKLEQLNSVELFSEHSNFKLQVNEINFRKVRFIDINIKQKMYFFTFIMKTKVCKYLLYYFYNLKKKFLISLYKKMQKLQYEKIPVEKKLKKNKTWLYIFVLNNSNNNPRFQKN